MPLLSTRRQRLTSSVVAVFALAATAGWFTQADAQSGRRNQTPPIVACEGEDVLPRTGVSVNTGALPDLDLAVQTIARENATTQELTLARDSCARARVNRNRHALVAYQCVANAQNRLAASERAQRQYERAYCANQAVVVLTEPSRAASRSEVNRDAHKSVGDALMSLRDIFGAGSTTGATMLSAAVREYEAAVNGQNDTSAARHFALGRAYRESGNLTGANTQMSNGSNRPIANAQEADQAVRALMGIAAETTPARTSIPLLERARDLDRQYLGGAERPSVSISSALGTSYLDANRPTDAAASFRAAINGRDDQANFANRNYLADANYYLASQAFGSRDWQTAFSLSQNALRAGGGREAKYGRLMCLAYIARGWTDQTQDATACAVNTSTPQGELLGIMYNLRQAQYVNVRDRYGRDVITLAGPARDRYQALMVQVWQSYERANMAIAGWTPEQRTTALNDWPGAPAGTDIRHALAFGRWVLGHECAGNPALPQYDDNMSDNDGFNRAAMRGFYENYNVSRCR